MRVGSPSRTMPAGNRPSVSSWTRRRASSALLARIPAARRPKPTIAAGWYLTEGQRHYRWYDGASWTAHTRPAGAPSDPS
jgi:hypothetical protein